MQKSELKEIYVSYPLGDVDNKIEYCEPERVFARVKNANNVFVPEMVGVSIECDKVLIIPYGAKSMYINENTLLWIDTTPNEKRSNMDFKIKKIRSSYSNNIIAYCDRLNSNTKAIYYEYKGKIIRAKLDYSNLVAFVPFNTFLPINSSSKLWLTKPDTPESIKNRIKFVKKERLDNCFKLYFEKW